MITIQSFTFNPFQENTYVLYNEQKEAIIIDPGCYIREEENELNSFIVDKQLNPTQLINTHTHIDHVLGNAFVQHKFQLLPLMHKAELPVLRAIPAYAPNYGIKYQPSAEPESFLEEGDIVKLGEDELMVLFTPGHSPGSISFYSKVQQFVISGDVLFYRSIGRTDLTGGNYDVLIDSINTKLMTLPDDTIVYSGHGGTTTIGAEKMYNPFINQ